MGLIGGGRWAAVHRNALLGCGAELSAVLVSSEASAERVRREWAVSAFTELEDFLTVPGEAVIVASPNHLHASHALASLAAGRHVLVEKPMGLSAQECSRVVEAGEAAGLVVAVGHEMRLFGLFEEVKRRLDQGEIGAPVHLKLDLWRRPHRSGAGGWKAEARKLGSTILEEPIHYLDLARWYLGRVSLVQAWANSRSGREGRWENLEIRLDHGSGARSWVTRSIAGFGHQVTLMLVGQEGALRASWRGRLDMDIEPVVSLTVERGGAVESVPVSRRTGHAFDVPRQTHAFLEALSGRGVPAASGYDGLAAVSLCLAAERSLGAGGGVIELG